MNATSQIRSAANRCSASRIARVYTWITRSRTNARARRTLAELDSRTLRDIGFSRRDLTLLRVADSLSSGSR